MKTEKEYIEAEDALRKAGWAYLGAGEWNDPVANVTLLTSIAYAVMVGRTKWKKRKTRLPCKPRPIHWQDWIGIAKELRKQLKPFGLTIKTRGHILRHGDFIEWKVEELNK